MRNALFEDAIYLFKLATKATMVSVKGTNSYLANYNIGVIYECLGDKGKALEYYNSYGKYDCAISRIEDITKE